MSWTGGIVIYLCSWFVFLWVILPRGVPTQQEVGEIEPGTPAGAPAAIAIKRKFLWAALLALIPLISATVVAEYQLLTVDDFDFLFPKSFLEEPISKR